MTVQAVVRVNLERGPDGRWFATSEDVFGLNLCSVDRKAVLRDIRRAIKLLFKANNGIDVEVTTQNRVDAFPTPKPAEDQYLLSASGRYAERASSLDRGR